MATRYIQSQPGPSSQILSSGDGRAHRTASRDLTAKGFKVDPLDYKPLKLGLRQLHRAIVIDYQLRSSGRRFLHNIKVSKYLDTKAFGISVSRSGSFKEALELEIEKIVDNIYADHCEYLPPERIERAQVEDLVKQLLLFSQQKKHEQLSEWNEVTKKGTVAVNSKLQKQSAPAAANGQKNSFNNKVGSAGSQKQSSMAKSTLSHSGASLTTLNANDPNSFFKKRSTSSPRKEQKEQKEQPDQPASKGPVAAKKKGKKKGKKRTSESVPPVGGQQALNGFGSFGKSGQSSVSVSQSIEQSLGKDDVATSKSLTDLADLPLPGQPAKKTAALGWDDDGFDDWNFEDVEADKKPEPAPVKPEKVESKPKAWEPPKVTESLNKKKEVKEESSWKPNKTALGQKVNN